MKKEQIVEMQKKADELKPCPRCGYTDTYRMGSYVGCDKCNYTDCTPEDWNRRAMPECVRVLRDTALDAAFRLAGDGDTDQSDDVRDAANRVTEYYGVTK